MMSSWEMSATFLAVVTSLVAVPLTVLTFYLRSIREHQLTWQGELVRRCDGVESLAKNLRQAFVEFERDCVKKEEWLRESMDARRRLENLQQSAIRIEAAMDALRGSDAEIAGARPFDGGRDLNGDDAERPRTIRVEEPL